MKRRFFLGAALSVIVLLGAGCQSDTPPEDLSGVPEAAADPMGGSQGGTGLNAGDGSGFSGSGTSNWGDPAAVGAADKDGWREADPSGNRLNMPVIYFAYDSDVLVPSETANLDKIARYMSDKPTLGLVIEGHCDQRGTEEYNRALGERRANAIRAYLVRQGVADAKIKTVSYGEDKPAVSGNGESIWKQNRRGVPVPMIIPQR